MARYFQGKFKPLNPQKYLGDPTEIYYRSSWEFAQMRRLDQNPDVIAWNSEGLVIPYRSPIDGRMHRYFTDLYVERRNPDGSISRTVIEIKPEAQTRPPILKEGKRITKAYKKAVETWGVNQAKWKAARAFCESRGVEFVVLTEKELFS